MLYAVISKNPFIYLHGETEELLKSDYDFIVENPDECDISKIAPSFNPVEYQALTPSLFASVLDTELDTGDIFTFVNGELVRRHYQKSAYFYLVPEYGVEYPTYCKSPGSIKAALVNNKDLAHIVGRLVHDYKIEGFPELTAEVPLNEGEVLAYVCIPITMRPIQIGVETEEEKLEIQEDQEF